MTGQRTSGRTISIAHDYLTQRGGAERVVLTLANHLPDADLATALFNEPATFSAFAKAGVQPSFLNRIALFRRNPQLALPLLPLAWTLRRKVLADVVIASSSGWAHAVRTAPRTVKIVYCHNPARWLYQSKEYLQGRSRFVGLMLRVLHRPLVSWDRKAARSADVYLANSTNVAKRIKTAYGIDAQVLHPPVDINVQDEASPLAGLSPGFFLTVGRDRGYKGTQKIVSAFRSIPNERLVVVGQPRGLSHENVECYENLSDGQLRWLYANARALISVSQEDFGLTPIEANAFGTPALCVRAGGFLDSLAEGTSGQFIASDERDEIIRAVNAFPMVWDREQIVAHAQRFSAESFLSALMEVVDRTTSAKREQEALLAPRPERIDRDIQQM